MGTMIDFGGKQDVLRLSCAETAQLVRQALKTAFPGHKFSVRAKTYSGGASVDIAWTDGPTAKQVDAICKRFEGATFDGMIDLKSYREPVRIDGQLVSFGADYVMTQRELSADLLKRCALEVARKWDCPVARVWEETSTWRGKSYTYTRIDREGAPIDRYADGSVANYHSTPGDKTIELAHQTSAYKES